jgi:hypothetical protein
MVKFTALENHSFLQVFSTYLPLSQRVLASRKAKYLFHDL